MENRKVERVLVPFFGEELPKKAEEVALDRLNKGGKIFLLHILDEAPTRSIRYRTGQMGEESEIIKIFKKTQEKVQEKSAKEYAEKVKKKAAKKGVSTKALYVSGNPTKEVIKAAEQYSIDLVLIEQLRDRMAEIFLGKEIDFICGKLSCEVKTI
ncbi:MAG: universal stress protein [Candidatus Hadarchaeia archaeon]